MQKFVLAYHGAPKFETKEDGMNHMTAWRAWSDGLGEAKVDAGMPVGQSHTIHSDGSVTEDGGSNPLMGFSVIQAETIEDAIALAKPCPHISAGGSIEIAPAYDMEM